MPTPENPTDLNYNHRANNNYHLLSIYVFVIIPQTLQVAIIPIL